MKLPRGYKVGRTRFGLYFIQNTKGQPLVYGLTEEAARRALHILREGVVLSKHRVSCVDL
mgnify:CR=1 FL=1